MSRQSSACKAKVATLATNVDLTPPITSLSTLTSICYQNNEDSLQHNDHGIIGQQKLNSPTSMRSVLTPPNNHVNNLLSVEPDRYASVLPYSSLPSSVQFDNQT